MKKHFLAGWRWLQVPMLVVGGGLLAAGGNPALAGDDPASDAVVARVNGQPIYGREVLAGVPSDAFGLSREMAMGERLQRLISARLVDQFLAARKIMVAPAAVEAELQTVRRQPPPQSCGCCYYKSFDDYLAQNGLSLDDFRLEIRCSLGMRCYLDGRWTAHYPTPQAEQQLAATEGRSIRDQYWRISHIFFLAANAEAPGGAAERARQRLEHDRFEVVARDLSEDRRSAANGGFCGVFDRSQMLFLTVTPAELKGMRAGEVSPPLRSMVGIHLVKWDPVTDADVLQVLRQRFESAEVATARQEMENRAKIENLLSGNK